MSKKSKIILYSSIASGIIAIAGITTPLVVLSSNKSSNVEKNNYFSLYDSNESTLANNESGDINNKVDKELLEKIKNFLKTTPIHYDKKTNNLTVDITNESPLATLTAEKIKSVNPSHIIEVIQIALVKMGIVQESAKPIISFSNWQTKNDETNVTFDVTIQWSNQLPPKVTTIHVAINNLYPKIKQDGLQVSPTHALSDNNIAWIIFGILIGFGAIALVATLIYIMVRKTRIEAVGDEDNNEM